MSLMTRIRRLLKRNTEVQQIQKHREKNHVLQPSCDLQHGHAQPAHGVLPLLDEYDTVLLSECDQTVTRNPKIKVLRRIFEE